jgi:hypothetical protein
MFLHVLLLASALSAPGPELGIGGTRFTLDGKPTFLLGASYYGGLGVEDEAALLQDLDALRACGFNWIRVWATWSAFDNDVSAVGRDGEPREPYLSRLKRLCRLAGERGMVVDVTLSRGDGAGMPGDRDEHLAMATTLARALLSFRNAYFDVANERNIGDARHVPDEEVGELIAAIKGIDPRRLCTASHGGDIDPDDLRDYLDIAKVDFVCPHRPRDAESPRQTREKTVAYLEWMKEMSRAVPVHYQEPFRRGYGEWEPAAPDFAADLDGARAGGAAGWCFHNGSAKSRADGRPRRSFDLRPGEGGLSEQLDAEERAFLAALRSP